MIQTNFWPCRLLPLCLSTSLDDSQTCCKHVLEFPLRTFELRMHAICHGLKTSTQDSKLLRHVPANAISATSMATNRIHYRSKVLHHLSKQGSCYFYKETYMLPNYILLLLFYLFIFLRYYALIS